MRTNLAEPHDVRDSPIHLAAGVLAVLQGAATDAGAQPGAAPAKPAARAVAVKAPEPTWLLDYTLAQTALLATVAAQTPIVLLLTYFLLASGVHFRRKLVQLVGPSLSSRQSAPPNGPPIALRAALISSRQPTFRLSTVSARTAFCAAI